MTDTLTLAARQDAAELAYAMERVSNLTRAAFDTAEKIAIVIAEADLDNIGVSDAFFGAMHDMIGCDDLFALIERDLSNYAIPADRQEMARAVYAELLSECVFLSRIMGGRRHDPAR